MTYSNNRHNRGNKSRVRNPKYTPRNRKSNRRKPANIPQSMFINKNVASKEVVVYTPEHNFDDFKFSDQLSKNISAAGFKNPSSIQDQTIPIVIKGRDVIGLANTGTGKTGAFLLPILQKLSASRTSQSVLIMSPTRELAQQIDLEFKKFAAGMKLYSAVCVGGVNIHGQIRQIKRNPHVIIGTPGRLQDLLNQGILRTTEIDTLVLDEADRMLDMGFINDIRKIVESIPSDRQTLCFSATMSDGVKSITRDFMKDPEIISVKVRETNDHIYQDVVHFNGDDHKKELLVEMLMRDDFSKVIVFGETKYGVQRLSDKLEKSGISAAAIHGNKSQSQRNRTLKSFKASESTVLVATDVAARGLDIPNVSHVINYDLPQSYDDYVHRIGRTGRGGKTGVALTFVKGAGTQKIPRSN